MLDFFLQAWISKAWDFQTQLLLDLIFIARRYILVPIVALGFGLINELLW
jgi:hypothetical protein